MNHIACFAYTLVLDRGTASTKAATNIQGSFHTLFVTPASASKDLSTLRSTPLQAA